MREVQGYNCVDNEWIGEAARSERERGIRLAPFEKYFLCVARLVEKKNLPRLLYAYAKYRDTIAPGHAAWGLVLVGEGPMRQVLESQIDDLHLKAEVHLAGRVDQFNQVVNYHAHAQAVILASHHDEQWGLVINEAMAAGRPVLVSKQCGCASSVVKEGVNGFTFDGESIDELAARMIWMSQNESALNEMGVRSAEVIRSFSPEKFAENVRGLYMRVSGVVI
jgi:glycosyltransferase involved in cell wall biosynthesis